VYVIYFFNNKKFNDTAFFGGDTWEYQSMAVNWITGHGLSFGGYEPFSVYKFSLTGSDVTSEGRKNFLSYFKRTSPLENFYRTPGYPVFLGLIYKLFGIHPAIVKQIQLLIFIIIGGFLPFIGWFYWKKQGLIAGTAAGFIFINTYSILTPMANITHPSEILAEPLITFMMFVLLIASIFWQEKKTLLRTFILGVILGLSLLIKGSNIYIPVLYALYFFYLFIKKGLSIKPLIILITGIFLIVIPWSVYASIKTGHPVILSTQGENALLDTNNEFTSDGRWHPEGFSNGVDTFYLQPWIKKYPDIIKVLIFYSLHPNSIPPTLFHKIDYGFTNFPFFELLILLLIYFQVSEISKNPLIVILSSAPVIYFCYMEIFAPISLTGIYRNQPLLWLLHSPILIIILSALMIYNFIKGKSGNIKSIPIFFVILYLNFFLISVTIFGLTRYVQVIDFMFMLTAFRYLLLFGESIIKTYAKN
jgi:hypothetical protein